MRVLLLLALLPGLALAQARPPSSGGGTACALASSTSAFATYFRATTVTAGQVGFQCDGVNPQCVDLGPGSRNAIGTNISGEILLGPGSGNTTVVRNFGDYVGLQITGSNITASSAFLLGASGLIQNATAAKPVLVNDADGFQVACKTAITTCTSALENSEIPVCGTGGALTKRCVCMGDGTTYAWRNLFNLAAGAGTTTTCPAT